MCSVVVKNINNSMIYDVPDVPDGRVSSQPDKKIEIVGANLNCRDMTAS